MSNLIRCLSCILIGVRIIKLPYIVPYMPRFTDFVSHLYTGQFNYCMFCPRARSKDFQTLYNWLLVPCCQMFIFTWNIYVLPNAVVIKLLKYTNCFVIFCNIFHWLVQLYSVTNSTVTTVSEYIIWPTCTLLIGVIIKLPYIRGTHGLNSTHRHTWF